MGPTLDDEDKTLSIQQVQTLWGLRILQLLLTLPDNTTANADTNSDTNTSSDGSCLQICMHTIG